jgi:RES domain-containing protein
MEVFRLSKEAFAHSLSGKGAALRGTRWNSLGVEIIYTAANRSLAMAEVAVHLSLASLPKDYRMVTISVPDDILLQRLNAKDFPIDWNVHPPLLETQRIGDAFVANGGYCLLQVPSAVTQGDFNYLINPHHADFARIEITDVTPFPFDRRIFGEQSHW